MSDANNSDVCSNSSQFAPRTIVLCFDGTKQQYGSTNTNVVKFFGLLRKDNPEEQITYYQAGIGTYFAPGVVSPLFTRLASLLDEAVAWYLDAHVTGGYKFLMENYRPGDKICLFGFSRGAYTARALAGMLHKVGLLQKDNDQQVSFAYKAYKRTGKEGNELAAGFKETFSRDVKVEFIGVWDTVQSTGILVNRILPFSESNDGIKVFRHALALDEHRARFRPNLYHWPTQPVEPEGLTNLKSKATRRLHTVKSFFQRLFKHKDPRLGSYQAVHGEPFVDSAQPNKHGDEIVSDEAQPHAEFVTEQSSPSTDVLEVWFSGCHSDIGGGNVQDTVKVSLAQITLHWMVEQVIQSQCGILFNSDELADIGFTVPQPSPQVPATREQTSPNSDVNGLPPTTLNAVDISKRAVAESPSKPQGPIPDPETDPERSDAIAPLFDELEINKLWWLLEIMPCSNAWQDTNGIWHTEWSINLGKGRFIPFHEPKFHHTVKERMAYEPLKYKPRAIYDHDEVYV